MQGCGQGQKSSTPPSRKPISQGRIRLPDTFGFYAVKKNGQLMELDKPVERLDEQPTLTLPEDVEFLVYGKDIDPSAIHFILLPGAQATPQKQAQGEKPFSWDDWMQQTQVEGPANFMAISTGIPRGSREGKLLVKPVTGQPQMLRLIPAGALPNGVYQIGMLAEIAQRTWYRFVVGSMPTHVSSEPNDADTVRREQCQSNLKQIGIACKLYSHDHGGKFPLHWDSLASGTEYLNKPKVYVCPTTGHQPGELTAVDTWSDYILVPYLKEGDHDKTVVLAFSNPDCYPGQGGNVLFADGHVVWCPLDEYRRLTQVLMPGITHR